MVVVARLALADTLVFARPLLPAIALTIGLYYSAQGASPVALGVHVEVRGGSPSVAAQVEAAALNAMAGLPPFLMANVTGVRVRIEPVSPDVRGRSYLDSFGHTC